jgi:phosphatidylglycerol lysyltransferase
MSQRSLIPRRDYKVQRAMRLELSCGDLMPKISPMNGNNEIDSSALLPKKRAAQWRSLARKLMPVVALAVFALGLFIIHHLLHRYSYREIEGYILAIPLSRTLTAVVLTGFSYFVLAGYDLLAFRYVGRNLPKRKIAFAAMTAFAFGNNIGLANLAGSSIRLRIYSTYGIEPKEIFKIIAFCSLTFWVGFFALAGAMLTFYPLPVPPQFGISVNVIRIAGVFLMAGSIAYVALCLVRKRPLFVRGQSLKLPSFTLALSQIAFAAGDWAIAGYILFSLMPAASGLSYPQFLSIFISAQVLALLAHVPGGVGVLEALVIYFVSPDHQANPGVLGGLLAYRAIYYLLPLLTAAVSLISYEIYRKRHVVARVSGGALSWTSLLIPHVAAVTSFLAGVVLLVFGATPSMRSRLSSLNDYLPLGLIEASHFLTACIGAALLFISPALLHRSRRAWRISLGLLVAGALLSISKALAFEEAILLTMFALLLFSARSQFHRSSYTFGEGLSFTWLASVSMALIGAAWVGFFSHRHIELSSNMWWTFAWHSEAPRFLRASAGVFLTSIFIALVLLLRHKRLPSALKLANSSDIEPLIRSADDTLANLAFMNDKSIFTNDVRDAFIMYASSGGLWIALGDPYGNPEAFEDLVLDFKEAADERGAHVVFLEVTPSHMPLYIELGYEFMRVAGDAIVTLLNFGLEGHLRRDLRETVSRLKKSGLTFEVHPAGSFSSFGDELKEVSRLRDSQKGVFEDPGFATGKNDPDYLEHFPLAFVRENGRLIAWGNLLPSSSKTEVALDLLQLTPNAPLGTAEFLVANAMLWGKAQGFRDFNLGRALPKGARATSRLLYGSREKLYNFHMGRAFKEKFAPVWKERFLAYPERLSLTRVFADIANVIATGPSSQSPHAEQR